MSDINYCHEELIIKAENELSSTDCVTPAFLVERNWKKETMFWWLSFFKKLKEYGYNILQVFIPDL